MKLALLGAAAFVVLAVVLTPWVTSGTQPPVSGQEAGVRARVEIACEREVRSLLVSPGTMRVIGRNPPTRAGDTWVYEFGVDSQNALGGLVRSDWTCVYNGTARVVRVR